MLALFREQPSAFRMIFLLELWERFGFYTLQGVLILYFIRYLGYSEVESYYTFGAFSCLVYGMVSLGGYLGDKVLGIKRTIVLGLTTLAFGYGFLAVASKDQVFFALGLVCVGNGLFKSNPSNLLSKCYQPQDPRLHGGFTLYYMAINLGSTFALFIGPKVASLYGYSYAYTLSSLGLVLGLVNYWAQRSYVAFINTQADQRKILPLHWILVLGGVLILAKLSAYLLQHALLTKNLLWMVILVVLGLYGYFIKKESKASALRMWVVLVLMLEAVLFFTLYQQMPTSINLFAVYHVTPRFLGLSIDPQSFQALNPLWIIFMSPLLAYFYGRLDKQGIFIAIPYKFALGMTLCSMSFFTLYFARYFYNSAMMVSSWWLIISYLFQSLGELLVSALGIAMIAELVPASITGFVMGMWFLTSAVSGFTGALVASYTALPKQIHPGLESLRLYTEVFGWVGLVTFILGLCMWLVSPYLSRYISGTRGL